MSSYFSKLFLTVLLSVGFFQVEAMTTRGSEIINSEGQPVELKGLNWFGFNNQQTMVDGLWGNEALKADFATVVYRMQLLGFNAVRLPFSFTDLKEIAPRNFLNNCKLPSISEIQASVTNPQFPVTSDKTIPPMLAPPTSSTCNDYLPNSSTFDRFVWVVNFFAENGFYVLVDNHLREDQTALKNKDQWIENWKELVTAISAHPIARDRLMIDILNEPDNYGVRWDALGDLYLSAMKAIYPINDKALFLIEGTGQGGIDANWGDGFATNPELIQQSGLSDPNPFFKELVKEPFVKQVVISPHVYPPSVTNANKNFTGEGLANRLTNSFGYLTQDPGYCDGSTCHVFPVAVGEFGSRFTEQKDLDFFKDFASYLNNTGPLADGKHQKIPNWFYWSWNANSGDTGGLVDNNWLNIEWKKIDYLTAIGLKPWYFNPADVENGNGQGETPPNTEENPGPVIEPPPPPPVEEPGPVVEPPAEEHEQPPKPEPSAEAGFGVTVQTGTPWEENYQSGIYSNTINVFITNTGPDPVEVPWVLEISNKDYMQVSGAWNFQVVSTQGGTVTGVTEKQNSWQNLLPHGGNTVNVGMVVTSKSKDFTPQSVRINGVQAALK